MKTKKVLLILVFILAAFLRFYGLNWDQGYHLHPDERWLTMVAGQISWPQNLNEFLSVDSPLNPKFFAYGSLPIYLLKFAGNLAGFISPEFGYYSNLNLLGRMISVFFDLGTLILVFLLGRKIWNEKIGLLAAFFYAIAVFPIQNAHFYTVDTQLTFWIILVVWLLTNFVDQPKRKTAAVIGIAFGAALATKVTAVFLLPGVILALGAPRVREFRGVRLLRWLKEPCLSLMFILGVALLVFVLLQPYALIDFHRFKGDVLLQSQMSRDATIFPYTIQYVGTMPYVYQLKNLVLWGLGLPLGILGVLGILGTTIQIACQLWNVWRKKDNQPSTTCPPKPRRRRVNHQQLILISFFWFYFIVMGLSAVKFMRYLLPLYPLLVLAAALRFAPSRKNPSGFFSLTRRVGKSALPAGRLAAQVFAIGSIVWTFAFMQIYTRPHTRVVASNWINQKIPAGSTLATEHWDDALPLQGGENFQQITLNLYDPDNKVKVNELITKITQADYIILSSNRLYDSIPKLPERYPVTIRCYELLFSEKLGFEKIKEFVSYPNFSLFTFHFSLNDSSADESFHVYDHPKVIIFKKTESFLKEKLNSLLRL